RNELHVRIPIIAARDRSNRKLAVEMDQELAAPHRHAGIDLVENDMVSAIEVSFDSSELELLRRVSGAEHPGKSIEESGGDRDGVTRGCGGQHQRWIKGNETGHSGDFVEEIARGRHMGKWGFGAAQHDVEDLPAIAGNEDIGCALAVKMEGPGELSCARVSECGAGIEPSQRWNGRGRIVKVSGQHPVGAYELGGG